MTMMHHDSRDRGKAIEQSTGVIKDRWEARLAGGLERAREVAGRVIREQPADKLVPAERMSFAVINETIDRSPALAVQLGDADPETVHRHAMGQLANRAGMPQGWARKLTEWGETDDDRAFGLELLADDLSKLYHRQQAKRYLTRSYDGTLRGVLSDRYLRMDSRPIIEAFSTAVKDSGAVIFDGVSNDVRWQLRAALQRIFEPVNGEIMSFGITLGNSDYGAGTLHAELWAERLVCTNLMTVHSALRRVHLGSRLTDNGVGWSMDTQNKDSAAMAAMVSDVTRSLLTDDNVTSILDGVQEANETQIGGDEIAKRLKALGLSKAENKAITERFSSAEVELLPPGQTPWRLSNAISAFALEADDIDARNRLEKAAGDVLPF
jgi:hypothetical protein